MQRGGAERRKKGADIRSVNAGHHEPQFDFYLKESIMVTYTDKSEREEIMFTTTFARMQAFVNRIASPAPADGTDLMQLYRLSRGSDSVRPAVIRQLAAIAAR
jgi:hypothetical protein